MKTENIYEISKDRPLKSAEIFQPNDFYGHASIIKKYVKLPENYQLKAAIEHGAGIGGNIWDQNINNLLPAMFTSSFYRSRILKNKTSKKIFIIGPKIQYARHYLNEEGLKIKKETLGKNLLSFPAHSTHYVNAHYDIQKYCQFLKDFGKNYQSIRICLYWKDILRGLDKEYERFGFQVETAGHMFDPLFLSRLKSIIEAATFTTSNNIGTILGYCVILNKPHLLMESEVKKDSQYKDKLLECSDLTDQPDAIDIREAFTELQEHVTPKQKEIVNKYWGIDEFKSVEEMGAIINECEKLYQKGTGVYFSQNKPKDDEFLFKGSFAEVLHEIGKVIGTYPRRKKGLLEIDNRAAYFSDLHSFYHQAIQIFNSDIYGFKTDKNNPVILDCGAHVGLASIYFATKYPNSSIHAFEADPEIAKMLTENINSFGLRMVTIHPKAVWINEEGVCFNKSGDDSGFISDEEPENIEKVSSIRLKQFIENHHVDLLKLDIEGAEYDVIKDCDEVLANVKNIIIEVHKFRDHNGSLGDILGILEKNHFEYTFGDFHFAEWLEPSSVPPFSSCKTNKYIITIFAWQPEDNKQYSIEIKKNVERALKELNSGQNSKAILLIENMIQEHPEEKSLYYALSVAYARKNNYSEARRLLAQIPEDDSIFPKASLLLKAIDETISGSTHLASYPRSGNTWMRFLLADIMLQQMGYETNTELPLPISALIPDMHQPNESDMDLSPPINLIKTHNEYNDQQNKSIYIFRNPADSLISYYYFHLRYPEQKKMVSDGADAFCLRQIEEWCRHAVSYIKAKEKMDKSILFVSYENMHNGLSSILKMVLNFINLPFDGDIVERAINNHTFEKHQTDEKLGDKFLNKFFRKGQCGYGERELSGNVVEIIHDKAMPLYREAKRIEEHQTNRVGE